MLKAINNSVLYIDYLQNVNNKVIPYCFFSVWVAGLAFTVTNKYHTKDNLYKVIAKSNNSSSYNKQLLRNFGI